MARPQWTFVMVAALFVNFSQAKGESEKVTLFCKSDLSDSRPLISAEGEKVALSLILTERERKVDGAYLADHQISYRIHSENIEEWGPITAYQPLKGCEFGATTRAYPGDPQFQEKYDHFVGYSENFGVIDDIGSKFASHVYCSGPLAQGFLRILYMPDEPSGSGTESHAVPVYGEIHLPRRKDSERHPEIRVLGWHRLACQAL